MSGAGPSQARIAPAWAARIGGSRERAGRHDGGEMRFESNGDDIAARAGETIIEAAQRHGVEIPHLCYTPGMRPDGNCRACMVEIKGERVLAPSCCRAPTPGMEVSSTSARAVHAQKIVVEMLVADVPERVYKPDSELAHWRRRLAHRQAALRGARAAGAGPLASRDGGQPRRLHPVHALRARLPRGAGQRRHRLRVSRRALADRVRPRRPDGRVDLRGLRRMRAGLPHGRARAGEGRLSRAGRAQGGVGVPVLRRRLPAHLPRQGRCDRPRRGPRRPRQPGAPVREGALRLRLRAPSAAADEAADPEARRAQSGRLRDGSRQSALGVPRSELGGGARARRRHAGADPRRARRRRARRLRLGQGLQRGGVPVPEAGAHRLSAPTTSITARGSATRRAWRRCSRASDRARCRIR